MPANPSPFSLSTPTFSSVSMSWGSVGGVDGYRVFRRRTSVSGAAYSLVEDTTGLSYTDTVPNYDMDTLETTAEESWEYKLVSYDSGGESSGVELTASMPSQTANNILDVDISFPSYNDGSDKTASYTITNPDTVTATPSLSTKCMHENKMHAANAYDSGAAN
jgi:hypothetical protein